LTKLYFSYKVYASRFADDSQFDIQYSGYRKSGNYVLYHT